MMHKPSSKPRRQRRGTATEVAPRRRAADDMGDASSRKLLVSFEVEDLEWLNVTVGTLKNSRRRTTKSEIVRMGLKLLREKRPDELKELLRHLY
jgi:hypothetical protein